LSNGFMTRPPEDGKAAIFQGRGLRLVYSAPKALASLETNRQASMSNI
jgi:hypothetical protein